MIDFDFPKEGGKCMPPANARGFWPSKRGILPYNVYEYFLRYFSCTHAVARCTS